MRGHRGATGSHVRRREAASIDPGSDAVARTSLAAALAWIDAHVARRGREFVPVSEAAGRVLAEDVTATLDVPPFHQATFAGIALRAQETIGAGSYNPLSFRLVEPGEALPAGGAVYLDAGDILPGGADAVVRLENVQQDAPGNGEIIEAVAPGQGIERAGSHVVRGETLFRAGQRLDGYDIGLIASAGLARVPVIGRCRVRLVIGRGGMETDAPRAGNIDVATGALLRALIERDGGILTEVCELEGNSATLRDALAAAGPDLILVTGSTGQSSTKEIKAALAGAGTLAMDGIAFHPGESAGLGRTTAGTPVFLLPAAPLDGLWAYEFLAGRAIRACGGRNPALPFRTREMTTARKIVSAIGQVEVCAVRLLGDNRVEPIASFAGTGIAGAAWADGFVIIPEGSEGFPGNAVVTVHLRETDGTGNAERRADRKS
jgi:molybdopterin molybdotransferase